MAHHVGSGLNFIPVGDGSVKIRKLWNNQADGVEFEVHLSKEQWKKVIEHCDHNDPVQVNEEVRDMVLSEPEVAQVLAEATAKELPLAVQKKAKK